MRTASKPVSSGGRAQASATALGLGLGFELELGLGLGLGSTSFYAEAGGQVLLPSYLITPMFPSYHPWLLRRAGDAP